MGLVVYYSSATGNTRRFVEKLGVKALRIPMSPKEPMPEINEEFILVCPTFADHQGRGAVPKQVIRFLNDPANRAYIRGVIAGGNRNFGEFYAYAGDVISNRCQVPYIYRFELAGTEDEVRETQYRMEQLWNKELWRPKQAAI